MDIIEFISCIFEGNKKYLLEDAEFFLKMAMLQANRLLGAFKMGNEEKYAGYASSVTCCLMMENGRFSVAHSGNTRLYIIRNGKISQLTKDHTKAAKLLDEGKIDIETYHVHPDRLSVTAGIGVVLEPDIQTFTGKFKENDLLLMTTDGIHYALQGDAIAQIVLESRDTVSATASLVEAAKNIVKYPDNMSAILMHQNQE